MEGHEKINNGNSTSGPDLRYFHISYIFKNTTGCSIGCASMSRIEDTMVTKKSIVDAVVEVHTDINIKSIVVVGILEFKNKLEFNQFYGNVEENTEG